jgi:hypothetical protein
LLHRRSPRSGGSVTEHTTIGDRSVRRGIRSGLADVKGSMATPEVISLIVALIVWIVLLGTLSSDA